MRKESSKLYKIIGMSWICALLTIFIHHYALKAGTEKHISSVLFIFIIGTTATFIFSTMGLISIWKKKSTDILAIVILTCSLSIGSIGFLESPVLTALTVWSTVHKQSLENFS